MILKRVEFKKVINNKLKCSKEGTVAPKKRQNVKRL